MAYELDFDGFDKYNTVSDLSIYGWSVDSDTVLSNTDGRNGGKCLVLKTNNKGFNRYIKNPSTHTVLGFAVKLESAASWLGVELMTCYFLNTNTESEMNSTIINLYGSQRINVRPAAKTLADTRFSESFLSIGNWNYIEIGIKENSAYNVSDGWLEIRVNGTSAGWLPLVQDVKHYTAAGYINKVRRIKFSAINATSPTNTYVDDLYLTTGDELKYMGDCRIYRSLLKANAAPQDWVPSSGNAWELLNNNSGYIQADGLNDTSLFEINSLPYNPSMIHGIKVSTIVQNQDSGTTSVSPTIKGSNDESTGDFHYVTSDGTSNGISDVFTTHPDSGQSFIGADLETIKVGVKVTDDGTILNQ